MNDDFLRIRIAEMTVDKKRELVDKLLKSKANRKDEVR